MKNKKFQMSRVTLSTQHNISAGARCTVKNRKQFKENFSSNFRKSIKKDFVINLMSNFKGVSYFFSCVWLKLHET